MKAYDELVTSLDQLVTVYRHLLDIVRKENDVLTRAEVAEVPKINDAKEKLVHKVRDLDVKWKLAADQIAKQMKLDTMQPSLMDIAKEFSGDEAKKLEQLHSVLTMLVERIVEFNKKNEILVKAALSHIAGAMDSITATLNENPTYKKSGNMQEVNKDAQGRLVHREA